MIDVSNIDLLCLDAGNVVIFLDHARMARYVPGANEGTIIRVEGEAKTVRLLPQAAHILHLVPRNVERDGRRQARQLVDDGAVVQLVEDVARLAAAGKPGKARAAGADAP